MQVNIASLRHSTFKSKLPYPRMPEQSILDYLDAELAERVYLVQRKIKVAAKTVREAHGEGGYLFFTLPEFFWNVPWQAIRSEEELHELNSAYLDKVLECVELLMSDLPVEKYGRVILLAGSCAALIKVGEGEAGYYDVINYLLAISNKDFEAQRPLISMWPKRYVSGIDFGKHVDSERGYWFFKLFDEVVVRVKEVSSVRAEHSYYGGFGATFMNSLIADCPFSINLCLDYAVLKEGERDNETELAATKIDFLIACGMDYDFGKVHPSSLQYLVRNDGMGDGECETVRLEAGRVVGIVSSKVVDETIYLSAVEIT